MTNYFTELNSVNVSDHVEKKGQFSYLSWAYAVAELKKRHPTATWEVRRFDGLPYQKTEIGFFVEVAVTVDGITHSQIHPVLNSRNQPLSDPSVFDINTSIQRALVKAIALHGLGLYIYAGEDLPEMVGPISGTKLDGSKIQTAANYFKDVIDEDNEENAERIQTAWSRLSNDEQLAVQELLGSKAKGSNRAYKNVLKVYLDMNKMNASA
jgi:hypothetical protein